MLFKRDCQCIGPFTQVRVLWCIRVYAGEPPAMVLAEKRAVAPLQSNVPQNESPS